jgi:hypothetical protein
MNLESEIFGPEELSSHFLAVKYLYVLLFGIWLLVLYRWRRPGILFAGAVVFSLYTWFAGEIPLKRLYAFGPPFDRMFNVAMGATSATGHSPFESYQVGAADLEPFWRLTLRVLALGKPENVLEIYPYLAPLAMVLLSVSLYFGLSPAKGEVDDHDRAWEPALVVYAVLLLSSSAHEQFGVFRSFWSISLLLKPNHVLGFVLIPLWIRAWTSPRPLIRTWVAGALLGVLAWVFLMHWSYVLVGLACFPLIARRAGARPELGRVALVAGLSLIAALPYILFLFANFHWGHGGAVARKVWLQLGFEEGFINVFSVGYEHGGLFFLSLAGIIGMALRHRKQDLVWLSLLLGAGVGWFGYLVILGLQKIIEPDEFYFYFRFLLSVAAGSGAYFLLRWVQPKYGYLRPGLVVLFLLLTLPQSIPYWWYPPKMDRYNRIGLEPLPEDKVILGSWIRHKTSPDAVFVAGGETSLWIASLSGRRVLTTGHHRPTHDYEERRELERRMLVDLDPNGVRAAVQKYFVTHIALDPEYLAELGAEAARLEALPWLELVYTGESVKIFAVREQALDSFERVGES